MIQVLLIQITEAAINGDAQTVKSILSQGVSYRSAQLFVEGFYQNKEASEFIHKLGHCECGSVAFRWNPEPLCPGCSLRKALSKIEYGRVTKYTHDRVVSAIENHKLLNPKP